jgi:hypothetical protein
MFAGRCVHTCSGHNLRRGDQGAHQSVLGGDTIVPSITPIGGANWQEMYTLEDRRGSTLCMRPENTAGLARAFGSSPLSQPHELPRRFYYHGPMFRCAEHYCARAVLRACASFSLATTLVGMSGHRKVAIVSLNSSAWSASIERVDRQTTTAVWHEMQILWGWLHTI